MSKTLDPLQVVLRPIQPPDLPVVDELPPINGLVVLEELLVSVERPALGALLVLGCPIALVEMLVLGAAVVGIGSRLLGLLVGFDWSGIKQRVLPTPTLLPAS
jgi:hypothetical protein